MVRGVALRSISAALLVAAAAATAGEARADTRSDELFREAVQLFDRGEVKVACAKFDESYKLDAAPGTLFNLASCNEKLGKLRLARAQFLEVVERANALGKPDKADLARERADAVTARMPTITLALPAPPPSEIRIDDDDVLPPSSWSAPVPVDPGDHVVSARAPGKDAVTVKFTVPAQGTMRVEIPPFAGDGIASPPPPSTAPPPHARMTVVAPANRSTRTLGFVVTGIGGAAIVAGGVLGAMALSEKADGTAACGASRTCASYKDANGHLDTASSEAAISTIAVAAGAVAVATGIYLVVTSPKADARGASTGLAARVAPVAFAGGGAGAAAIGRF